MRHITIEYILKLHDKMIATTGGSSGIKDIGLLDSAINNSMATFDGQDLYPTIEEKCAITCFSIINNHPFVDGNKRTGLYAMLILLEYNNIKLKFIQEDLIDLGLGIASGKYNQEYIFEWIKGKEVR